MALNLSTLTNPATSGDVLAEVMTTADFLEPVPVLRNLARGSQKGGDAKQSVSLNQPRALPLIKNPAGNLGGYLYIPNVSGNYATGPTVTIGANQTWEAEVDMVITRFQDHIFPLGAGPWNAPSSSTTPGFGLFFANNSNVYVFSKAVYGSALSGVVVGQPFTLKYGFDGTNVFCDINAVRKVTQTATGQSGSITHPLQIDQQAGIAHAGNYAIQKAKLTVNSSVVFDCDFNGSTSIRHGDTKFQAAVGGPVTLTRAGQDPVTVVKKSVLRFDGANDGLRGLFANNIDGGYMFAAFSVLGDGGSSDARVFSVNANGSLDYSTNGFVYGLKYASNNELAAYGANAILWSHNDMYDDDRGDILYEAKAKSGGLISKVNNANKFQPSTTLSIASNEFNVGNGSSSLARPAAIDLEFLALFPATITDDQAEDVRNYINNRNNVFSLIDSQGYYFFDGAATSANQVFTGSSSWPGRIIGSDNDDPFKYLSNGSINDRPTTDGYKITFADNSDHFLFNTPLTGGQAGWQVVGTSLGTFAYRVDNDAVTELNLLGNAGDVRSIGDLYGIIFLPASATGKDIEDARKLLIDRGAADGVSASNVASFWQSRDDIVEFNSVSFSGTDQANSTWRYADNMVSFNVTSMPSLTFAHRTWADCTALISFGTSLDAVTHALEAWKNCTSLSDFRTTNLENCAQFTSAWQSCSALTSFPAGAKLGTEANNVNFTSAWRSSGLTSFSTPLPTATNTSNAWLSCHSLALFNTPLPLSTTVGYAWYDCTSLTSFDTLIPLVTDAQSGWYNCTSLTSFDTLIPLVSYAYRAWGNCTSLTDFSADVFSNWNPSSITSGVFNNTWDGCTSLTAQSVENILTSIDASGHYATTNKLQGGTALGDAGIDIDYNTATGSLSAATNTAVTSLKAKGWSIIVNNVTL